MAEITAAMVQELREATNVGMMECKRALTEAGGNKDAAIKILRERGMAIAVKKSTRAANQGLIAAAASADGKTAFVADLAGKALGMADNTIADVARSEVTAMIASIGENIVAKRNVRYTLQGSGLIATYIHLGGKIGVIIELACTKPETASNAAFKELAKDLTLHIAACSPQFLVRADVPAAIIAAEREIYAKQVTNKPPQIIDKIVDGKMGKFYSQVCLVEQPFVKEPDVSITKLLEAKGKELGDTLTITRFTRYLRGE
jgi:elongation factor Ts